MAHTSWFWSVGVLLIVRCGVAVAGGFTVGIEMPTQVPITPAVEAALRDMGVAYINYYVKPSARTTDEDAFAVNEAMLALIDKSGMDFSLACFVVDPPEACVASARRQGSRFKGIVFDELEHCRLLNPHKRAENLADPTSFTSLTDAYEKTLAGYRTLHDRYAADQVPVVATHVFPVLHHVAARAGFIPCPKIQKEFYSPVSLAIGLGAALQYGRDLWVDCDLWYYDLVPGHPPEELLSNLQLAYWLGADLVYVEGAGHNLTPAGRQGIPFSLMTQVTPDQYQLTAHGEVLRHFIRSYVPDHPRPWTFRDIKPTVALVRFPDSDYGQRFMRPHYEKPDEPMADWHAGLYGTANLPSTPDTEAWFDLWNLLTRGATGMDGLSHFKSYLASGHERPVTSGQVQSLYSRPAQAAGHRFFVPLNNVVVFDHLVGYEHLRDIPLIFVTGVEASDATLEALLRRADEGATVVIWGNLARRKGWEDFSGGLSELPRGSGRVILTDTFSTNTLFQRIWPHMGRPDEIRYTFGDHTVVLQRVNDNEVSVQVSPR
jgi:hypothetical protein